MAVGESSKRPDRLVVSAPLPPSSNGIYANAAKGRVLTKEAREYKTEVGNILMTQRARKSCPEPPFALYLHLRFPDGRRTDADGRVKLLQDALFEHIGHDDSLVRDLHVFKYINPFDPGVTLELRHTERPLEATA